MHAFDHLAVVKGLSCVHFHIVWTQFDMKQLVHVFLCIM